jgi:hypothetical protein
MSDKSRLRVCSGVLVRYVWQGAAMSSHFRSKLTWKTLEIFLSKDLAYRPIVVHIVVIDGQVLKIKTTHLAWNQEDHKTCMNLSINRVFDIKGY